jgi:hypothetical protein
MAAWPWKIGPSSNLTMSNRYITYEYILMLYTFYMSLSKIKKLIAILESMMK